jgi:hypothetical protein
MSVHRFPRRVLTLFPQLCMGIEPGARFPARSADPLPATLYGHFTRAVYRNRPITWHPMMWRAVSGGPYTEGYNNGGVGGAMVHSRQGLTLVQLRHVLLDTVGV